MGGRTANIMVLVLFRYLDYLRCGHHFCLKWKYSTVHNLIFFSQIAQVPIPPTPPRGVLVKIAYCGVCHSDLGIIKASLRTLADMKSKCKSPSSLRYCGGKKNIATFCKYLNYCQVCGAIGFHIPTKRSNLN